MRVRTYKAKKSPAPGDFDFLVVPFGKDADVVPPEIRRELGELVEFKTLDIKAGDKRIGVDVDGILSQIDENGYAIQRTHMGVNDDVFDAALRMGYALQGRPDPSSGILPRAPDRGRALQQLWDSVYSENGLGPPSKTPEELMQIIDLNIPHAWKREALKKVINALSLIQKNDQTADKQAFELLGQAVWEKSLAEPDSYWHRQITDVWPTQPSSLCAQSV